MSNSITKRSVEVDIFLIGVQLVLIIFFTICPIFCVVFLGPNSCWWLEDVYHLPW